MNEIDFQQFEIFTILSVFLAFGGCADTSQKRKIQQKDSQANSTSLNRTKMANIKFHLAQSYPYLLRPPLQQQTLQNVNIYVIYAILQSCFNCF